LLYAVVSSPWSSIITITRPCASFTEAKPGSSSCRQHPSQHPLDTFLIPLDTFLIPLDTLSTPSLYTLLIPSSLLTHLLFGCLFLTWIRPCSVDLESITTNCLNLEKALRMHTRHELRLLSVGLGQAGPEEMCLSFLCQETRNNFFVDTQTNKRRRKKERAKEKK